MTDYVDVEEFDIEPTLIDVVEDIDEATIIQFGLFEGADDQDVDPPSVTFAVASGATIQRTDPVLVDVTDEGLLRKVLVLARFPSGAYEVAWDGAAFAAGYASSARTAIDDGYRFTLRRTGGWRESPTIGVVAIDAGGNEAVP